MVQIEKFIGSLKASYGLQAIQIKKIENTECI